MRSFFPRYKWVFFGIALILVVILIILTIIAFTPAKKALQQPAATQKTIDCSLLTKADEKYECEEKNKSVVTRQSTVPKDDPSCSSFSQAPDEIKCQEAEKIALQKYPGKIIAIDKKEIDQRDAWLIEIESSSSKKTRIFIDSNTGEIINF